MLFRQPVFRRITSKDVLRTAVADVLKSNIQFTNRNEVSWIAEQVVDKVFSPENLNDIQAHLEEVQKQNN